jgi:hypothetical protein
LAFWGDREKAASLNLGFIAVGLGALAVPIPCEAILKRFRFGNCLLVIAFLCLLPAVFTIFTAKDEFPQYQPALNPSEILAEPLLCLAVLVMFLYYPLEGSLHTWVRSYLANLGYDETNISRWNAAFWGVFLAIRLGVALYYSRYGYGYEAWIILVLVLISAFTLGNMAGAYGQRSQWQLLLIGLTLGSILPTFLGVVLAVPKFKDTQGLVLGILFSVGTISSLLIQPLLARFSHGRSVQVIIRVPLALALFVAIPCLILALIRS